ncbi:MAG: thiamine pyrophosphate-dependent dehydrogenase E1 component subunit alpha [Syntrophales bacterium]|nr:thiamine pyrophosphate-dependent dehydrogenase E1 component subunit alpha [Syntrophales bacterium]
MKGLNIELYKKMCLVRKAEEMIQYYYSEDGMKTPMHMSMGEEAIAVGVCHALKAKDQIFGTYRSHAIYLAKTQNINDFFAEMYGKDTALLKGKGGSMHMCNPDGGFMGSSGIVASAIPVAVGASFANKMSKNGKYVAVFFGDGATNEGVFWESLNAACLMKLPVLFICEDNGFAVHTPKSEREGYESLTDIVSKFNCHVISEETTDVEVIYNLTQDGIKLMSDTSMPLFLHFRYYRYLEHVGICEDYEAGYRSREEYLKWLERDPVKLQREKLLASGINDMEIKNIESVITEKVMKSITKAKEAPFCRNDELFEGVLV